MLYPLQRVGAKGEGRFERISWDQALDTIAANLKRVASEHGAESVLPYSYAGTMGFLNGGGMDRRFFHRLGASRLDRTICSTAGMAAMTVRSATAMALSRSSSANRETDHRLGREYSWHQRPPVAVHRRGAAQGREVVRHRSGNDADRDGSPTSTTPVSRQRPRRSPSA